MNQKSHPLNLLLLFLFFLALMAVSNFTKLRPNWGSLEMRSNATITVTGTAKQDENNQIAMFSAGVESIEASKEEALDKTTEIMNQLIEQIKAFGIKAEDIQTQNVNVYQETEYLPMNEASTLIYPQPDRSKAQKGSWRANNSISIKLRELEKAEALLKILNSSPANYVYGPDFSLDDQEATSDELLSAAVLKAREKAETIAAANKQKVGKILSLVEGNSYPIYNSYRMAPMTGGGLVEMASDVNLEPGSSLVSKTVTVTFELY